VKLNEQQVQSDDDAPLGTIDQGEPKIYSMVQVLW